MDRIPSFNNLKSFAKKDRAGFRKHRLAIMGDCATQHLRTAIEGYGCYCGYDLDVYEADYDQIASQVFDQGSDYYAHEPKTTLIFMCTEALFRRFCAWEPERRKEFSGSILGEIRSYWTSIRSRSQSRILQTLFLEINDRVFGNYGLGVEDSFIYQIRMINTGLMEMTRSVENAFLLDMTDIALGLGLDRFRSTKMYHYAKMPVSIDALPYVAKNVVDMISAADGRIKKCVILDLDNTLWGGVVGDDGLEGIQIGDLGAGPAFSAFQRYLRELKNRGILLAICSKNNEDIAKSAFTDHPDMVLRLEDISMFVANWNDKASNIRHIQKTLNIGMDSMVFIDDNPFERGLVAQQIPEITVPDMPEDPSDYVDYLASLNLFETASYSEEDRGRTKQYQAEASRVEAQGAFESYDSYLEDLDMTAEMSGFDDFNCPRIAQLTQRTNQFNFRTVRLTEDEVAAISRDDSYRTFYVKLKDRFGDYGLISVIILKRVDVDTMFVDNWVMSCRVLKRGVEEFIMNAIVDTAKGMGCKRIVGEYIETPKNRMVSGLYEQFGFIKTGEGRFELDVPSYESRKTFVRGGP